MTGVHQWGWSGARLLQSKQPGLTTFPGENDHNLRETQPTASHCRPFSSPPLCLSKPAHHWMVTVGSEVSLMFGSRGKCRELCAGAAARDPGRAANDAPLISLAVGLEMRWDQSVITGYWSDSIFRIAHVQQYIDPM